MAWTKEQRKAQSERMKNLHRLNQGDLRTMQAQGAATRTTIGVDEGGNVVAPETIRSTGGARVTTTGPANYRLYKRGNHGWYPVTIPANNITLVMGPEGMGNYSWECPECHGYCGEDGPCPVRGERPYRYCPVPSCRKKILDNPPTGDIEIEHTDAEIKDDIFALSTPELRTKAMLDLHLYTYHPSEAAALAPQSPRNPTPTPPGRMAEVS
jgi:hypothetical protein